MKVENLGAFLGRTEPAVCPNGHTPQYCQSKPNEHILHKIFSMKIRILGPPLSMNPTLMPASWRKKKKQEKKKKKAQQSLVCQIPLLTSMKLWFKA